MAVIEAEKAKLPLHFRLKDHPHSLTHTQINTFHTASLCHAKARHFFPCAARFFFFSLTDVDSLIAQFADWSS